MRMTALSLYESTNQDKVAILCPTKNLKCFMFKSTSSVNLVVNIFYANTAL